MKKTTLFKSLIIFSLIAASFSDAFAQKTRPPVKPPAKPQPIIFAVLNDGKMLEPIAVIDKGALAEPADGSDDIKILNAFSKTYYQPKTKYRLIFGGADAGAVTILSSDTKADCSANMATVVTASPKAKLKGFVMGLATNAPIGKTVSSVRRPPTAAERAEIETLVRAEFTKQKVTAGALKNLKYHNLTALDVDNDQRAELVGSFWIEPTKTTRAMLFFIADQNADGKYAFGYSDYKTVKQDEVMSGDITSLDSGTYHELLLDALEYDGDQTAEVFTHVQSFEGSGFNVYSRRGGQWTKAFEGSNYHCAF